MIFVSLYQSLPAPVACKVSDYLTEINHSEVSTGLTCLYHYRGNIFETLPGNHLSITSWKSWHLCYASRSIKYLAAFSLNPTM